MRWLLLASLLLVGCEARATVVSVPAEQSAEASEWKPLWVADPALLHFTHAVRDYCDALGCSVTSWGRTLARNERVGGVDGSHHLDWLAVDVVYDRRPTWAMRQKLATDLGLTLLVYRYHDHLHPANLAGGEV